MKFELTENELKKIENFIKKGKNECAGAIGGRYTYSFTPTTLGTIVIITDNLQKRELNVTDYDCW